MTTGYYMLILGYAELLFRDFESYHGIVVGLNEDDFWLVLKQYNAKFVTYELTPGIYKIEDISEAVNNMGGHEGTVRVVYDNNSIKTKLILKQFVGTLGTLRFDERSFIATFLGFTPYWDYKPTIAFHADNPVVYTSDKILNLSKTDKF